jgi:site-specific DNA-methyltransferase (adenine-specific)
MGTEGRTNTGVRDFGDSGGASRFFYVAKAPGAEKSAVMTCGCTPKLKIKDIPVISMKEAKAATGQPCPVCGEKQQLHAHPTVKSVSLMEWLVKLVTPPGGVVLDPFTGSGTTGVAARRLGFRFIGMEQDKVYCALARHRIK